MRAASATIGREDNSRLGSERDSGCDHNNSICESDRDRQCESEHSSECDNEGDSERDIELDSDYDSEVGRHGRQRVRQQRVRQQ